MHTSSRSTRRISRAISLPVRIASAGLAVAAATTAFAPAASASEFYANPSVSPIPECKNGQLVYNVGLYNLAPSNDSTTFTVTVSNVAEGDSSNQYTVVAGGQTWLQFTVAEGTTGSIQVTNPYPDKPVDFVAAPKADCVADPEAAVSVVCDTDGPTAANIVYEWRNTSAYAAHFGFSQASAVFFEGDYDSSDSAQMQQVPVVEGEHVTASIIVDGVTLSSVDSVVDCLPEPTIPDTVPETIPTTVPETIPTTTPTTEVPVTVVQRPRPQVTELPVTGPARTSRTATFGVALLVTGLGLVRFARRAR